MPAAREALVVDERQPVNPAMRAELIAMKALVLSVNNEGRKARSEADKAVSMTTSVEVRAFTACIHAIVDATPQAAAVAFEFSDEFQIWDPLVCAIRAHPPLLRRLVKEPRSRESLEDLLRGSNDFDLARRAGFSLGRRPRTPRADLSPREHEVAGLVSQGLTNKQIGELLFISAGTAKVHVRHIRDKMGARTRAEVAARYSLEG
jgi:DNA-binding CsgD family transcriptional regulator